MKGHFLFLLGFMLISTLAHGEDLETNLVLACGSADNRVYLYDAIRTDHSDSVHWRFPQHGLPPFSERPIDAKRIDRNGSIQLLITYSLGDGYPGWVRLIDYETGAILRNITTPPETRSAEILPDGSIVSINFNGFIRLHREPNHQDLKIPNARAAVWDHQRKKLWIIGDRLYLADYQSGKLKINSSFKLPGRKWGRALFPDRSGDSLLLTDFSGVHQFDCESKKFKIIYRQPGISSVSQHGDGSIWGLGRKADNWDTPMTPRRRDAIRRLPLLFMRVEPINPTLSYERGGAQITQARWWQRNTVSYGN